MEYLKVITLFVLVATVVYGRPSHHSHHDEGHDHGPGSPYGFGYAVKDAYHGTDYSHVADSNGDAVRGEYRTLLPDGRMQIVRYTADWKNGYQAEVIYENAGAPIIPPRRPSAAYALQYPVVVPGSPHPDHGY